LGLLLLFVAAAALPALEPDAAQYRYWPFVLLSFLCIQYLLCRLLQRSGYLGSTVIEVSDPISRKLIMDTIASFGFLAGVLGLFSRVPA
jgi:hypothetical protein